MGFDSVELVIRVENTFGIELPEKVLEQIKTPRDLIEQVCHRLDLSGGPQCQSQQAFYRLRKGLMEVLGVSRDQVRLETRLADLAPLDDCRPWWLRLRENIGARDWPELVRPKWMRRGIGWITIATLIAAMVSYWVRKGLEKFDAGLALSLALAGCIGASMLLCTRKYIVALPPHITSVSNLILFSLSAPGVRWTKEGVASTVKAIIMDHLNLTESAYGEDKRFIEDLGVD